MTCETISVPATVRLIRVRHLGPIPMLALDQHPDLSAEALDMVESAWIAVEEGRLADAGRLVDRVERQLGIAAADRLCGSREVIAGDFCRTVDLRPAKTKPAERAGQPFRPGMTDADKEAWAKAGRIEDDGRRLHHAGKRAEAERKFQRASEIRAEIAERQVLRADQAWSAETERQYSEPTTAKGRSLIKEKVIADNGQKVERRRRTGPDGLAAALLTDTVYDQLGEARRAQLGEAIREVKRLGKIEARRLVSAGLHYRNMVETSADGLGSAMGESGGGTGGPAEARAAAIDAGQRRRKMEARIASAAKHPDELAIFKRVAGEGRSLRHVVGSGRDNAIARGLLIHALQVCATALKLA